MDIIYNADLRTKIAGENFKHVFTMDVSSLNILAFSYENFNLSGQERNLSQLNQPAFGAYICALEQPWNFRLITTSIVPIVQLAWSLDGRYLLSCNQAGLCRIFQSTHDCINEMLCVYEYETHDDIIYAKYLFPTETIHVNLNQNESIFYGNQNGQSSLLQYGPNSANFICVTSSGTIHTLPLVRSLSQLSYPLSMNQPLGVSLCDIFPRCDGFNIILGERKKGAIVYFFFVNYCANQPKVSYMSYRGRGFRIPSCYGILESIVYFQQNGIDSILTQLKAQSGDSIELYQYSIDQGDWKSMTLLSLVQTSISHISLPSNMLLIDSDEYQGLFGRQILVALSDGSIVNFDKFNFRWRKQYFLFETSENCNEMISNYFIRIQHTKSGSCCVGFTNTGRILLLRTVKIEDISSSISFLNLLTHLYGQYIIQTNGLLDIWDILCVTPNNSMIHMLLDKLVINFQQRTLEFKRCYFIRFKQCLFHLHRLAHPQKSDSLEHLITLLVYQVLLVVRDHLRLFIYEPTERNFVDAAQEILQQSSFVQTIDTKRIKYLIDNPSIYNSVTVDPQQYESISFITLVNWISDIIFYFITYLQYRKIPQDVNFKHLFFDTTQLQWLREFMIYFYILNKTNRIPFSHMAHLQIHSNQSTTNLNEQVDVLKEIYNALTKFSQKLEISQMNIFDENFLENFPIFTIELLQTKLERLFPRYFSFLIPNLSKTQSFIRDKTPFFASHLNINPNSFDNLSDIQFDIITLGKMSLSSNPAYRRCIRCSNFSRVFPNKPYPFLSNRLLSRCLCGGSFFLYTQADTHNV